MEYSLSHLQNILRLRKRRLQTKRTLSALDDHILRDIGLARGDIDTIFGRINER